MGRGSSKAGGRGGGALSEADAEALRKAQPFDVYSEEFKQRTQYTGGQKAGKINSALRTGEGLDAVKANVDAMDGYMTPVGKSFTVVRNLNDFSSITGSDGLKGAVGVPADKIWSAINSGNASGLQKYAGKTITDKGFVSTSYNAKANAQAGAPVQMRMHVKKGTKAIVTGNKKESEVILHRNLKYKVRKFSVSDGVVYADVDVE